MVVGSQQGRAWNFQEGQGEASLVQTPMFDRHVSELAILNDKERRAKAAADADDFQKRIDALNKSYQEMDFRVQGQMTEALTSFVDDAAAYQARTGRNPFLATNRDPEALRLQQGMQKMQTIPRSVGDVAGQVKTYQERIMANPDKYERGSIDMYADPDILGMVREGRVPIPRFKMPVANLADSIGKQYKALGITNRDAASQLGPEVIASLNMADESTVNAATQALETLPEAALAALNQRAEQSGVSPILQYQYELGMQLADPTWNLADFEKSVYEDARKYADVQTDLSGSRPMKTKAINAALDMKAQSDPYGYQMAIEKYGSLDNWRKYLHTLNYGPVSNVPKKDPNAASGGLDGSRALLRNYMSQLDLKDPAAKGLLRGFKTVTNEGREATIISVTPAPQIGTTMQGDVISGGGRQVKVSQAYTVTYAEKDSKEVNARGVEVTIPGRVVTRIMNPEEFEEFIISPWDKTNKQAQYEIMKREGDIGSFNDIGE